MDLNKDEIERAFEELEKKAKEKAEDVQEDLEEEYQEVRKDVKSWYAKTNDWIMRNLLIVVLVIVAAVGAVVYTTPIVPKVEKVEVPAPVKAVEVLKEKIEEVDNSNIYRIDLDKMEVRGRAIAILKDSEGNEVDRRFIVKRRFIGSDNVSEFVTIKEPLTALKYNKTQYDIYLKNKSEQEKILTETK